MIPRLNEIRLIGEWAGEPRMTYTKANVPMVRRMLRVSKSASETEEFEVLGWGTVAEVMEEQEDGCLVLLIGKVKTERWGPPDSMKTAVRVAVESCQQICELVV